MNKFHVLILLTIISIFIGIVYITQKDSITKVDTLGQTPSLPASGDKLEFISQAPGANNQAAQQQQQAPQTAIQGPINASVSAVIKTSKGDISVTLFGKEAQKTVANFIGKSKSNFYKGLIFHRVEDWVVQGGDPAGKGTGGNAIQTELNSKPFIEGSLGMAASSDMQIGQGARISNDSQFFITTKDADWLNGQYTNFGIVTSGMDVVSRIKIGDKILGIITE